MAGVTLPAGRPGGGAPDATVVLAALRERAAELSPAQRRAVEATVWPRVRQTGKRTRAVDPVTGCRDDTFGGAPDVGMTQLARERRASIAATIPGYGAPPTWQVCVYQSTVTGGAYAETAAWTNATVREPGPRLPGGST